MVFGNLFIGFCAAAQCLLTGELLSARPSWNYVTLIFLCTCIVYNFCIPGFIRVRLVSDGSRRMNTVVTYQRPLQMMTCIFGLLTIPLTLTLRPSSITMLTLLGILSFLYILPLIPWKGARISLRNIPGLKMIVIVFIWTVSTVWIPVHESSISPGNSVVSVLMLKQFLFISTIATAFDIRDITCDRLQGLRTIPAVAGSTYSKVICFLFLVGSGIFQLAAGSEIWSTLALELSLLTAAGLIYFAGPGRSNYFYFLALDGICIFQYLLVILFKWVK